MISIFCFNDPFKFTNGVYMKGLLNDFVTDCFITTLHITTLRREPTSFPSALFLYAWALGRRLYEKTRESPNKITNYFIRLSRLKNNLAQIHLYDELQECLRRLIPASIIFPLCSWINPNHLNFGLQDDFFSLPCSEGNKFFTCLNTSLIC